VRVSGGRRLVYPCSGVRPTKAITRQAIFNVLGEAVKCARVLDLFAGGGALGIEAISRGAVAAVFVESSDRVVKYLRENLRGLDMVEVVRGNVFAVLPRLKEKEFDIVFADPPYSRGLAERTVVAVARYNIVRITGWLVIEHSKDDTPVTPAGWEKMKEKAYGESMITFFRRQK